MSVTKSFAGSLTGILVERGLLHPDMVVTTILPELAGSAYDGARLRHVLDMTVGREYNEDYANPESDIARLDVAAGWRPWREGVPDNLRDYMTTMRKAGPHGVTFHYVSTNTDVLGDSRRRG
jgi:CubicO group peptidase (beta-lactamase class C family)